MLASDSKFDSTDFAAAKSKYDPAYIHEGCSSPNYPQFCKDHNCKGWHGWYCNDGQYVDHNNPPQFNNAWIRRGCTNRGVQFSNQYNGWYCKDDYKYAIDNAYIKRGCPSANNVHYMRNIDCKNKWNTKCAHIEDLSDNDGAWYCGDENIYGMDPSDFDAAFITKQCNNGVHYDENWKAWYCN